MSEPPAMRVLLVSTDRADAGLIRPIARALIAAGDAADILVTGSHGAASVEAAAFPQEATVIDGLMRAEAPGHAEVMAHVGLAADAAIRQQAPDWMLVIGDRFDMIPAATACLPHNLPLAQVHAGDETLGAIDDRIRHAVTKLAHLALVANAAAEDRVLRLGEEPWRVVRTGSPALDTLAAAPILPARDFAERIGLETVEGLRLVTVHAETNGPDPAAPARAVVEALRTVPGPTLITAPNRDPGGAAVRAVLDAHCADAPATVFVDTLGAALYPSALAHAAVVLGNSSSGLIEAGLFGTPTVDVGDRQAGRERGASVTHSPADGAAVADALARALAAGRAVERGTPYGDGRSAPRIVNALRRALADPRLATKRVPA